MDNKWVQIGIIVIALAVGVRQYVKYRVAPEIEPFSLEMTDLQGNPTDLEAYRGKPVILNFFTTWCAPCLKEMPALVDAQRQLEKNGFVVLAVSDESLEKLNRYKNGKKIDLQFLRMTGTTREEIGVHTIPTTYLLNKDGEVVFNKIGAYEWNSPETLAKFRELAGV